MSNDSTSLRRAILFIVVAACALVLAGCAAEDTDKDADLVSDLNDALSQILNYFLATQYHEGYWMGSFVTDTSYTANYVVLMHYLDMVDVQRQAKAVNYIRGEQQPDGGWNAYPGGPSAMDISVIDYFALKLAGIPAEDPDMIRARDFILQWGGAEQTNELTQSMLALFGQVPWKSMLPLNTDIMLFEELLYRLGIMHTALIPFSILRENYAVKELTEEHGVREIFLVNPWKGVWWERPPRRGCCQDRAVEWILERQEADGNWGGVFNISLANLLALKSVGDHALEEVLRLGMQGVVSFQNEDENTLNQQFSQSPVMDTAYVIYAMLLAGVEPSHPSVRRAVDWLVSKQTTTYGDWHHNNPEGEPGGWSFEHENEWYPDVDCAVMVLDAFSMLDAKSQDQIWDSIQRGINWVVSMQNADGGWAAWDKDAIDIAEVIPALDADWIASDTSSADLTARTIMSLSHLGYPGQFGDQAVISRGVEYLKGQQEETGAWFGRWGVNYTYGAGQVIQALAAVGEDPSQEYIQRAIAWLKSVQNPDGGWGEDPISYVDPSKAGIGPSSAALTAYVLIGLMSAGETSSPEVQRGFRYLLDTMRPDGSWYDHQFLGTNIPGTWYSRYELASTYKPAAALAMYLKQRDSDPN